MWSELLRHWPGRVGLAMLAGLLGLAVLGPIVYSGDPFAAAGPPLQPPGSVRAFGTDDLGRDVLLGAISGARVSLTVGFVTALAAGFVGTCVGAAAGYFGGTVDDMLMRLAEAIQVVPRFFLATVVAALFGSSLMLLLALLAVTFWPPTARLLRAEILSAKSLDYVTAARVAGASSTRIILRHVLPNTIAVVIVSSSLQVGAGILVEASLSFLGLGDRSLMTWGQMLNNAQPFLRSAWYLSALPGSLLAITVLAASLVGEAIQIAVDPRLRREHGGRPA